MRRWEELRPELENRGVQIVTICADTSAEIRKGRGRHGLQAVMLADPELEVTDHYGLRNPRNLTPTIRRGVVRPLPIPTTILADATGTVRWIDQAEDYQIRSHPDRVLAALREHLGGGAQVEA